MTARKRDERIRMEGLEPAAGDRNDKSGVWKTGGQRETGIWKNNGERR